MKYGIKDKVPFPSILVYALQQVMAVFVATVLIANICGTPVDACLIGAAIGTLIYQVITGFKSPMFISSCGATCSAVIGALAIGDGSNYLAVCIGGLIILAIYGLIALIVKLKGTQVLNKIFPPIVIGPITMVIGLNLAGFIPTYTQVNGDHSNWGIGVALVTMLIVALASHYLKGFWKTIPFLVGLVGGTLVCVILSFFGIPIISYDAFKGIGFLQVPDFSFLHWNFASLTWSTVGQVVVLFVPVAICACLEHLADHRTLSGIVGTDLTQNPGLHRTLLGDGVASALGTITCGLPNTSYGESIATVGFSGVAATSVISVAAAMLAALAFISPVQALIATVPAAVFGGCAMILYGFIALSGLRVLVNGADLSKNRSVIIVSAILTIGVSGIWLFHASFAGVSLAMVVGVLLNLILKDKEEI